MMEIIDISSRILSQAIKVEREYLSNMNSTTSHEMRNPLNAIKSQIKYQEKQMAELQKLIRDIWQTHQINEENKNQID